MSIKSIDYRITKRADGGIQLNPFQQEATLVEKSKMLYARKKEFNRDGVKSYKLSIALSEDIADTIQDIEHELHGQYEAIFCTEEGQVVPQEHSSVQLWNNVKWFNVKVDPTKIKVFEKTGKKLVEKTYSDMPADADVFPIVIASNAWVLPIGGSDKFGVSFQVTQLFFRKNMDANKKSKGTPTPLSLHDFI